MPTIVKGDGSREAFDIAKLELSLERSGATSETARKVASEIAGAVIEGMTTTEIYRRAFKALKSEEKTLAARYSMRRAILDLGPTGFPFEDYFCELMRVQGYSASVRQAVQGRCTSHEVDVVLEKEGARIGVELKFHNQHGLKVDTKTGLYVRARFWDIEYGAEDRKEKVPFDGAWLVTNTKFTSQVIQYARCANLTLLGWSYPRERNLADIIRQTGLYPITVLPSLTEKEKTLLLANRVTLCRDVARNPGVLSMAGISKKKHTTAVSESVSLCGT